MLQAWGGLKPVSVVPPSFKPLQFQIHERHPPSHKPESTVCHPPPHEPAEDQPRAHRGRTGAPGIARTLPSSLLLPRGDGPQLVPALCPKDGWFPSAAAFYDPAAARRSGQLRTD